MHRMIVIIHVGTEAADAAFEVPAEFLFETVDEISGERVDLTSGRLTMPPRSVRYLYAE